MKTLTPVASICATASLISVVLHDTYIGDASGQGGYNGRQQVVRTTHADNSSVTYAYDDYGNRTTVTDELLHPATTDYDDYRRPIRQTMQVNDTVNRYSVSTRTSDNQTFPFTYDARSNTMSQLGWSYTYDALGRLITANGTQTRLSDAATVTHAMSFRYDPVGRCCQRTLDGATTTLIYDGWGLIEERTAQNALIYLYVHGAGTDEMLCRQNAAGTRLYYHYDALGNVTHLTDANGAVVESYRYMPYGRPEIFDAQGNQQINDVGDAVSPVNNRFLFKGREYLERPELYDLRNRHYSPETGRFLQPDPAGFEASGVNLYAYCGNDPVNNSDPSGLESLELSATIKLSHPTGGGASSGPDSGFKLGGNPVGGFKGGVSSVAGFLGGPAGRAVDSGLNGAASDDPLGTGNTGSRDTIVNGLSFRTRTLFYGTSVSESTGEFRFDILGGYTKFPSDQQFGMHDTSLDLVDNLTNLTGLKGILVVGLKLGAAKLGGAVFLRGATLHHIATNKNLISTAAGGPYSRKFAALFQKAGLDLESSINKIYVLGHRGPHPDYNRIVYERLTSAVEGLQGVAYKQALEGELKVISYESTATGSVLNRLLTGD